MPTSCTNLTENEDKNFQEIFHKVHQTILDQSENNMRSMEVATNWLDKVISHNVSRNISDRILVSVAYKNLVGNTSIKTLEPAFVLDCCLEYFYAANSISDNLMDGRGKWHTKPEVGMLAVNDAMQLTILSHFILKTFFHDRIPLRYQISDICTDALNHRILGRGLHEKLKKDEKLEHFNLEIFRHMVNLTFGYNKFYVPVRFALKLKGEILDCAVEKNIKDILLDIGYCWKIRSDYVNHFEKENNADSFTKSDLKLNWLFVKAVETLQKEKADMNILLNCLDQKNIAGLKMFYEQKGMLQLFKEEQTFLMDNIKDRINNFIVNDNIRNLLWSVWSQKF